MLGLPVLRDRGQRITADPMASPWTNTQAPPVLGHPGGVVTLVEGAEFFLCDRRGDVTAGAPHGLFFLDTRFVSQWELALDGVGLEPLDVVVDQPFAAQHVLRGAPSAGHADAGLVVVRRRRLGRGLREDVVLRNHSTEPLEVDLTLTVAADFADLFEVKEGHVRPQGRQWQEVCDDGFVHGVRRDGGSRALHLAFSRPPRSGPQVAAWTARIPAQGSWEVCFEASYAVEGEILTPRYRCDAPIEQGTPHQRLADWHAQVPGIHSDHLPLETAARRATADLGMLRLRDPDHPEREIIAAGAPWFMTLFGRDSLLTAWMSLLVDQRLATGVLHTLARFQGERVDPHTDQEPGRILHEMRFGSAESAALDTASVYYGSVDATPLFVMLLGELSRWGLPAADVAALMPHAERALAWIESYGDRDGDGYVEYQRASDRGLEHQGWKDSWDALRFADGRFAQPPIALCEVQAYVYGAFIARADYAQQTGDLPTAERWVHKAAELKARFNHDFWLEDRGWFALALDADKQPVDALTSNIGHCLWAGIVDEDKARLVVDRLMADELFSGWGVRTMATTMAGYNPVSYHNGSVWPHDTAICVAGLMRYGFTDHAHRLALSLLDAAQASGGRLPELFCGFARDDLATPVAYPTSCSPQAWAAAAPLLVVRSLLRFDPWVPHDKLWLAPVLPAVMRRLHVEGIPLGDARLTVNVDGGDVTVDGLPDHLELVSAPRAPLSAYLATMLR